MIFFCFDKFYIIFELDSWKWSNSHWKISILFKELQLGRTGLHQLENKKNKKKLYYKLLLGFILKWLLIIYKKLFFFYLDVDMEFYRMICI